MTLRTAFTIIVFTSYILIPSECKSSKDSFDANLKRVVCYLSKENEERIEKYKLYAHQIDPFLCTHILYSVPVLDLNGIDSSFVRSPKERGTIKDETYSNLLDLRFQNRKLKLMLSLEAFHESSKAYSEILSNNNAMKEFINSLIVHLRYLDFDGIDINWQWPTIRERGANQEKTRFSDFLKELRDRVNTEAEKTKKDPLIISLVLPQFKILVERGYDLDAVTETVDMLNLWTFDYSLSTDRLINHGAPLYCYPVDNCDHEYNVDYSIQQYFSMGLEPDRMNLGIPAFGNSYILDDMGETNFRSTAEEEGHNGFGLNLPGKLSYFEICQNIKSNRWSTVSPNRTAVGPYSYRGLDWVAYDDTVMIKKKVEYANRKCIGGVMFWTIDMDDFSGSCYEKFELIKTAKEALDTTFNKSAPCEGFGSYESALHKSDIPIKRKFRIIKRDRWLALDPTEEIKKLRISPAPYVIIAHTAGATCDDFETCRDVVRNIQNYQISIGFGDIGYQFLVGGDGNVYEGLGWELHGAHTLPFNARSICIAFMGDYSTKAPTNKQLNATFNLIDEGLRIGKISPDYKLFGQRQVIATLSPGKAIMDIIRLWPHYAAYDPVEDDED